MWINRCRCIELLQKNVVRLLEFREGGKEYTEINIYEKDAENDKDGDEPTDSFVLGFTLKGKGKEVKDHIEKMNEEDFEKFLKRMMIYIEKSTILHLLK